MVILIVAIVLSVAASLGWYFLLKKSLEGESCKNNDKCQADLKCINQVCSSGKLNSVCNQKSDCETDFCVNNKCTNGSTGSSCGDKLDCQTGYCVNSKCTEGKKDNACNTYKDCSKELLCQKGVCTTRPDYSKYFDKVIVSKMKPGLPPGPDNPLTVTNRFTQKDAIEVDFKGVKSETVGEYYVEMVDSVTGEIGNSTKFMKTKFEGHDVGFGTDLQVLEPGTYDLNLYFQEEIIYSTQIIIQ